MLKVVEAPRLRNRPLANEPLSKEDWMEVYHLYVGFQNAVEAIVRRARRRAVRAPQSEEGRA